MKNIKVILIKASLLITNINVFAQAPSIQWQNVIGGSSSEYVYSCNPTSDGGYILGGYSYSGISGDKTESSLGGADYWVIKLDSLGNIVWQNTIGGSGDDALFSAEETVDGGFILGGYSYSGISGDKTEANAGGTDCWIIKLNSMGSIVWQNTIGGTLDDGTWNIQQTSDGGFIMAAYSSSNISGDKTENSQGGSDYWVVKLTSTGLIAWQNTIGGTNNDWIYSMDLCGDGGYILGGYSYSGISGDKTEDNIGITTNSNYWIIKINATGDILWQNSIGGIYDDKAFSVEQTIDGGYIIGGYGTTALASTLDKLEGGLGGLDYWVVKLNNTGSIEWENTIGGSAEDYLYSIDLTPDGGFILGGYSTSSISGDKTDLSFGSEDYWVLKLNSSGNILWQNVFGGLSNDRLRNIQSTIDGGFILTGHSLSGISGNKTEASLGSYDYWVIKLFPDCIPSSELCNLIDDDCDGAIDDGIAEAVTISAGGVTTFCQGGSVVLSATYTGTSVQWQKDGVNIAGATLGNYTVTNKGNYTCVTTSLCGSATSTGIYVTVNKNPSASIAAGGPTTFCAGESVILTEVPSGGCTYQWYKGASALVGATSTSYIATVSGNYKCRVTKAATGCYKNSNTISVNATCKEGEIISDLIVYPNPTKDILIIEFSGINNGTIEITNIAGQIVFMERLNDSRMEIKVSEYPVGMYILKFISEENETVAKFIKE